MQASGRRYDGAKEEGELQCSPNKGPADPKCMGDPGARMALWSCPKLTQGGQAFLHHWRQAAPERKYALGQGESLQSRQSP